VPPTGSGASSSGKAGKVVKLLSSVADDEGTVSAVEQVKRNGRVIKTIKQPGTVAATSPRAVSVAQAPSAEGLVPALRVAVDAAGNKSLQSCAKVTLRS
jgi:hypothetical protein